MNISTADICIRKLTCLTGRLRPHIREARRWLSKRMTTRHGTRALN
jgi:hypothetical protein